MTALIIRAILAGTIIVIASELAERSVILGAILASLPTVALLSMILVWRDTGDRVRVAEFATATFWYVVASLPMFLVISGMLRASMPFWLSLAVGVLLTAALFLVVRTALSRVGVII
jgi:hypothetical protein